MRGSWDVMEDINFYVEGIVCGEVFSGSERRYSWWIRRMWEALGFIGCVRFVGFKFNFCYWDNEKLRCISILAMMRLIF